MMRARRQSNPFQQVMCCFAVPVLLLQLLLPMLHLAVMGSPARIAGIDPKEICLTLDEGRDNPGQPNHPLDHRVLPCAVCQTHTASGGFAPPMAIALAGPAYVRVVYAPVHTAPVERRAASGAQARAPPRLA